MTVNTHTAGPTLEKKPQGSNLIIMKLNLLVRKGRNMKLCCVCQDLEKVINVTNSGTQWRVFEKESLERHFGEVLDLSVGDLDGTKNILSGLDEDVVRVEVEGDAENVLRGGEANGGKQVRSATRLTCNGKSLTSSPVLWRIGRRSASLCSKSTP